MFSRIESYIAQLQADPVGFLITMAYTWGVILFSLILHECAHGYVALKCGDPTAKMMGRLSLNPARHLHPIGTLFMFVFGFGWAKPVPVNPWRFKGDRVKCDLLVSVAGITINLIFFVLFTAAAVAASYFMWDPAVISAYGLSTVVSYDYNIVWSVISGSAMDTFGAFIVRSWLVPVVRLCAYTALVNINLAVFNLLPLPPLDGYHVLNDLVFKGRFHLSRRAFQIGMAVVLILSYKGILGDLIYKVVFPAQRLLLMPFGAVWG